MESSTTQADKSISDANAVRFKNENLAAATLGTTEKYALLAADRETWFIGQLPRNLTVGNIRWFFAEIVGVPVMRVKIIRDPQKRSVTGSCFIECAAEYADQLRISNGRYYISGDHAVYLTVPSEYILGWPKQCVTISPATGTAHQRIKNVTDDVVPTTYTTFAYYPAPYFYYVVPGTE